MFLMRHFSSNCHNAYGYQTFQGGDMPRRALTRKYAWHLSGVVLWITWQIKYKAPHAEDTH